MATQINRTVALAIFTFCQWKSADKWDNARMATKLKDIKDVMPDTAPPEEIKDALIQVTSTIAEGGDFVVVDDETSKAPEVKEKAPKAAKEPKAPKEPKAAKEPKEPKVKEPKAPKKGRPYCAAVALKEAGGPSAAITDALIARVDELCEKPNAKESKAWLLIAAQVISGWEGIAPAAPAAPAAEAPAATEAPEAPAA